MPFLCSPFYFISTYSSSRSKNGGFNDNFKLNERSYGSIEGAGSKPISLKVGVSAEELKAAQSDLNILGFDLLSFRFTSPTAASASASAASAVGIDETVTPTRRRYEYEAVVCYREASIVS